MTIYGYRVFFCHFQQMIFEFHVVMFLSLINIYLLLIHGFGYSYLPAIGIQCTSSYALKTEISSHSRPSYTLILEKNGVSNIKGSHWLQYSSQLQLYPYHTVSISYPSVHYNNYVSSFRCWSFVLLVCSLLLKALSKICCYFCVMLLSQLYYYYFTEPFNTFGMFQLYLWLSFFDDKFAFNTMNETILTLQL